MALLIIAFLLLCFVLSIFFFKQVGKPYNGLFIILSAIILVAVVMAKYEGFTLKTPWASVEKEIDTLVLNQNQIRDIVEETIELIELVSEMPKPAIMWGEKSEKAKQDFLKRIEIQKNKLKNLANIKK